MKFGVDIGSLDRALTGIGVYVARVLDEWTRQAPADEFLLYSANPPVCPLAGANLRPRWETSRLPGSFWLQLRAGPLARRDGIRAFWAPSHVLPLSLDRSVRAVVTVHDLVWLQHPETMARRNLVVHRLFFRRSVRRADHIITVSEFTRRELIDCLGVPGARITAIHQGVDESLRPLSPDEFQPRLRRLGLAPGYLLALGTVEPRKNYSLLFQALARLAAPTGLVIAGKLGWKCSTILDELDRLNLRARVRLLDYVPDADLPALFAGARLLVLPSVYEGFGLPVIQAMACGVPVLASNSSSLPEIGGPAAAYFESGSVDALAAGLTALLADPARCRVLRELGLVRAREFTWQRTARRTLAVLKGESPAS